MTVRYPPISRLPLSRVSEHTEPRPSLQGYASRRPTGLTIITDLGSGSYSNTSADEPLVPQMPYHQGRAWDEEGAGAPKASCLRRCPAKVWGWVRRVFGGRSGQGFGRSDGPHRG